MVDCQRGQELSVRRPQQPLPSPAANRQIRRLVLSVHGVFLSAICAAQVGVESSQQLVHLVMPGGLPRGLPQVNGVGRDRHALALHG
jgi:hypothetical protein